MIWLVAGAGLRRRSKWRGRYVQGTVYAFSCHPEVTPGCEQFVLLTILTARHNHPAVATAE